MAWLTESEVLDIGFKHIGNDVLISNKASFYGAANISIGDRSRIDDFCVLSAGAGGIDIGCNVHVAVFCSLIGAEEIKLSDFSCISSRVSVYSSSDDFSGLAMTNPTVPAEYTNVRSSPVLLGRHVVVGSGAVILPGSKVLEGASVGALSLVRSNCSAWGVHAGVPAKFIKARPKEIANLERDYLESLKSDNNS